MSRLSTEDYNREIGGRLEAVRAESQLSQIEFALKLGLSPRAYANYERGDREMPVATYRFLCDSFMIDPLWMLRGPEKKPRRIGNRNLDAGLMEDVIRLIEKWLDKHQRYISAEKKARVIRLAYEHCIEKGKVDSPQVTQWLDLAA